MPNIAERLKKVNDKIAETCASCGRSVSEIKLVVVTKSATIDQIRQAVSLGCRELGENRVQRLVKVSAEIDEFLRSSQNGQEPSQKINWNMIGHLQRNKIRKVLPIASLIHSVDTLRLAESINSTAAKVGMKPKVMLQVNASREPQKYGVPVAAGVHLAEQMQVMKNIELAGLMTMAPLTRNKDHVKSAFARTKELFEEIKSEQFIGREFCELSMGMSSDYETAIENGATILRIGSAIFSG
jgi:hypothetical protein